jgi:serine/threonine protein phosphatase PrpC
MEDEHVIIDAFMDDPRQGLFAVYDGHGGREAVEFASSNVHHFLAEELRFGADATTALKNAFWATDQAMLAGGIGVECGCTALVVLVRGAQVFVANAGDTRAVVSRGGTAMRVSIDHTATDPHEARRVRASGGFIEGKRVGGITQTSRGLGDHDVQHLVPEPDIHLLQLEPSDSFLIMASDGVWDVINDQLAVNIASQMGSVQEMAETLVRAAVQLGSEDNISALVIGF